MRAHSSPHFPFPSSRTTTISAPMAPLLSQNYETISPVSELAEIPSLLSPSDSAFDTSNDISGNSSLFCLPRHFSGCILGSPSARTPMPHKEGSFIGGPCLFIIRTWNQRRCHERNCFGNNWASNQGLRIQGPLRYLLCYYCSGLLTRFILLYWDRKQLLLCMEFILSLPAARVNAPCIPLISSPVHSF